MMDTRPSSSLQSPLLGCTYTRSAPHTTPNVRASQRQALPFQDGCTLVGSTDLAFYLQSSIAISHCGRKLWPSGGVTFLGAPVTIHLGKWWGGVVRWQGEREAKLLWRRS